MVNSMTSGGCGRSGSTLLDVVLGGHPAVESLGELEKHVRGSRPAHRLTPGQSLELARAGHEVVICDISAAMLRLAAEQVAAEGLEERVTLLHCSIQELENHLSEESGIFDVVLCHAVMEWLAEPRNLLPCLMRHLSVDGLLSLTFYNLHSMVYKNLLRTNYRKVLEQDYAAFRGSLTPINPLDPAVVAEWLAEQPLEVLCTSGIRVFYDYLLDPEARRQAPEAVLELELRLSRQEPYRSLGRYVHVLARAR
jgi:S-adenosylmethionine-dependent methyltransferase